MFIISQAYEPNNADHTMRVDQRLLTMFPGFEVRQQLYTDRTENWKTGMQWLLKGVDAAGKVSMVFVIAGHGDQAGNIYADFEGGTGGNPINENQIHEDLFSKLPAKARLFCFFFACYSGGNVVGLQDEVEIQNGAEKTKGTNDTKNTGKNIMVVTSSTADEGTILTGGAGLYQFADVFMGHLDKPIIRGLKEMQDITGTINTLQLYATDKSLWQMTLKDFLQA